MTRLLLLTLALLATSLVNAQDKRVLFDGRSLDGWQHIGPGRHLLETGLIRTEGGMGLLWYTPEKFGDCVIEVVYRIASDDANSGVFVRIADKPPDPWFAVHHGYEVQIHNKEDAYHRTGAIYSLSASSFDRGRLIGSWNTMEIVLRGEQIKVRLNGKEINRFDPTRDKSPERKHDYEPERGPRPTHGYIGLQNHSAVDTVWFKSVAVRPLADKD